MKTTVLLITFFFITITSFGQSKNYAERKASLEAKKEAIRKRKNDFLTKMGNGMVVILSGMTMDK